MVIYQIKNTKHLKKWQIGVLELSTFEFISPKKERVKKKKPKRFLVKNASTGIDLNQKHLEVKKLLESTA